MGQDFASLGFGCWKNYSPFQGPYQGEQKFIQIPLNKSEQDIDIESHGKNNQIKLQNGETFAIWECKRARKVIQPSSEPLLSIVHWIEDFDWSAEMCQP